MNSSGMKRGLAISAVAAMTLTGVGITAGTANAVPLSTTIDASALGTNGVKLLLDSSGTLSTQAIGSDPVAQLAALAGSGVAKVQFSYDDGSGSHDIGQPVAASPGGFFELGWTPPPALNNLPVGVTATALDANGNQLGTDTVNVSVVPHAANVSLASTQATVGLYKVPGTGDYFGAVSGVTTDLAADPNVEVTAPLGAPGTSVTEDHASTVQAGDTTRTFSAAVDFGAYTWDTGTDPTDQALVSASDGGTVDSTVVDVYEQDLSTATVTATAANPSIPTGGSTSATVTVLDAQGNPIVGAYVEQVGGPTVQTNSSGEATFTGLSGSAAGTDYSFFVDGNGNGSWDSGSEFKRTVTVTEYAVQPGSITVSASDDAYDFDELSGAPAEFAGTLKDTQGNPMQVSGTDRLSYNWTVTPFDTSIDPSTQPTKLVATNAQGEATFQKPNGTVPGTYTLQVWKEADGTPGPTSGDLVADPVKVLLGQAHVFWDDGPAVSVKEGSQAASFTGSLQLVDDNGDPVDGGRLGGRDLSVTLHRAPNGADPDGDAVIAPQADQAGPGTVTRVNDTTAAVKTDAEGDFGINVKDTTVRDESVTPATGAADYADSLTGSGSGYDAGTLQTHFMDTAVGFIAGINGGPAAQGTHNDLIPGVPDTLFFIVENAEGQALIGQKVSVAVDHGYLSKIGPDGLVPATEPAEGGLVGAWRNDGKSVTLTTSTGGLAAVAAAIGHDDGFADDGEVDTTVDVSADGVEPTWFLGTDTIGWETDDALNPTDLHVELAPAAEQDPSLTKLPDAGLPVNGSKRNVVLRVSATDQFGNEVELPVDADVSGPGGFGTTGTTGYDGQAPNVSMFADLDDGAGTQTFAATLEDPATTTWHDTNTTSGHAPVWDAQDGTGPDLTDSASVNWYAVDFDDSVFALDHNTADTVKPGTAVIESYTATDQKGAPIDGADVTFFRAGPDDLQDGEGNAFPRTDDSGAASYLFQGTRAGKAIITAVMEDAGDNPLPATLARDEVTFAVPQAPAPKRKRIHVTLRAKNVKHGRDRLTVKAPRIAKGAHVRLFRVVHGHLKRIGGKRIAGKNVKTIGAHGFAHFTVKENKAQRRHRTTYVVKVSHTDHTRAAKSNKRRIR